MRWDGIILEICFRIGVDENKRKGITVQMSVLGTVLISSDHVVVLCFNLTEMRII